MVESYHCVHACVELSTHLSVHEPGFDDSQVTSLVKTADMALMTGVFPHEPFLTSGQTQPGAMYNHVFSVMYMYKYILHVYRELQWLKASMHM